MIQKACDIILLTSDYEMQRRCEAALELDERLHLIARYQGLDRLQNHLGQTYVPLVIVDIDPQPTQLLHDLGRMINHFTRTRFVVVSDSVSDGLMMEAMNIGARDFLLKEQIDEKLSPTIHKLIRINGLGAESPQGQLIAVLSSAGGCGSTTLAVNLANELHLLEQKPTLLVDLDCCYGGIGSYLGLHGNYGIADVLAHSTRVDSELIRTTVVPYDDAMDVLLSPASVHFEAPLDCESQYLGHVLDVCRYIYPWTVIDAPHLSAQSAVSLASASSHTFIVSQLSVKDLRAAQRIGALLLSNGVSPERIEYLVNRFTKRGPTLPLSQAREVLKDLPVALIRNDFKHAEDSFNLGRPLADSSPRSMIRRDVRALAAKLISALGAHASVG